MPETVPPTPPVVAPPPPPPASPEKPTLPPEYQQTNVEKVTGTIGKHAPFIISRLLSRLMYGIFQLTRLLIQTIKDALG